MNADKSDNLERRQPTSASRTPWKSALHDNLAMISDRDGMPVVNVQVFAGSKAHGRFASNVALIARAASAHYDLVALARDLLPQLRAAAESDMRAGLRQSDAIRRFHLANNGLVAAGVRA